MSYQHPFADAPENVAMIYTRPGWASRLACVIRDGILYTDKGGRLDKLTDLPADAVLEEADNG